MISKETLVSWREQNKRGECIHGVIVTKPCHSCYQETAEMALRYRRSVEPGVQLSLNLLMKKRKKGGSNNRLTQKQVNKGGGMSLPRIKD